MQYNEITVEYVCGRSRITELLQCKPLKILTPGSNKHVAAEIILSNYGGGFVAGDSVNLKISCMENASLFIGTQANSRVYKNETDKPCTVKTRVELHSGCTIVQLNDPLVLYRNSSYEQYQEWVAADDSVNLLMIEYLSAGRMNFNETFQFTNYKSHFKFSIDNKPYFIDRQRFTPNRDNQRSCAHFGISNYMLNIFAFGKFTDAVKKLSPYRGIMQKNSKTRSVSIHPVKENGISLRALGVSRTDLDPVIMDLFDNIEKSDLFFNPLKRKF